MLSMTPIKCSVASINLPNGDPADGRYYVRHNGIIYEETFYKNVGKRCGLEPALARAVGETMFNVFSGFLREGYRVELPQMSVYLTMQGKKAAEAKGHKSKERHPAVHLQPRGKFRDCCKDAFEVELVTRQAAVYVFNFADANIQTGAISRGVNVKVSIVGGGLYMPDTSDPTVGVWIEDSNKKLCTRAVVDESGRTYLVVHFPKIDLPTGPGYYFCIASRDGSEAMHSVRTVRRRLTILPELPESNQNK